MAFLKILLQPTLVAMVTKFRQHAPNLNIVVFIAVDTTQNYNHWSYFIC